MESKNSVPKQYHKNRLALYKVENNLFNGDSQTTYYFVNRTSLTEMEKFIVNYILNFTQNGNGCYTPYLKIAFAGGYKCQSIEPTISRLTKAGLITKGKQVNHKDNSGSHIDGGLWVDINNLFQLHKEYNDANTFDQFEADYRAYQAEKQAKEQAKKVKKDKKLKEQAAEIEKLKQMLAQQQITSNDTSTEDREVDQIDKTPEEEVVSDNTSIVPPVNSDNGFRLSFNGEHVTTVKTLDDVMFWLRNNGERLLAKDAVEKALYYDSDSDGACGIELNYKDVYGELIITDLQPQFTINKSA